MFGNLGAGELLLIILAILVVIFFVKYNKTSFKTGCVPMFFYIIAGALVIVASRQKPIDIGILIGTIILSSVLLYIGYFFSKHKKKIAQASRDEKAHKMISEIRMDGKPKYSLYLRPFLSTGKIQITDFEARGVTFISPEAERDLETVFAEALEPIAPLIALGIQGEQEGAGRVHTLNKNWQSDFIILAENAKLILLLPSNRSGTLWEIHWILKNKVLNKCFFFMPPQTFKRTFDWAQYWKKCLKEIDDIGLKLPPYNKKGLIFNFGENQQIFNKTKIGKDTSPLYLRREINKFLENYS